MSEVRVTIGGREYTVACGEGEEAHVAGLAGSINDKLSQLGENLSPSESQNLLFGALFVADELHEARKSLADQTSKFEAEIAELKEDSRKANLAIGQRDELKLNISRLEAELDGMQSAQQRHSTEVDDIRKELTERREEALQHQSDYETAAAQVNQLERERDDLKAQIENKNLLLERANEHIQKGTPLGGPAAAAISSAAAQDPDLAPALERFADLLENCADKLESKAAST